MDEIIRLENISKFFGGTHALKEVNLSIKKGSIHVLMGENGAGKSTLSKIMSGFYKPDKGRLIIDGKPQNSNSVVDGYKNGICMIYQEPIVCPDLTVRGNLLLGIEKSRLINRKYDDKLIKRKLDSVDANLLSMLPSLDVKLSEVDTVRIRLVELARSLMRSNIRIFILDEFTASMGLKETELFFRIVEILHKSGYTVVYVTHKMEEALKIADYITVMRNGRVINTYSKKDFSEALILKDVIGKNSYMTNQTYRKKVKREAHNENNLLLKVVGITGNMGNRKVVNVSFELYRGEVLGFAGLVGSGRSELLKMVMGISKKKEGRIFVRGREIKPTPFKMMKNGVVYLSEVRDENTFEDFDSRINIPSSKLAMGDQYLVNSIKYIRERNMRILTRKQVTALKIVMGSIFSKLKTLSGGNRQKVALARILALAPEIVILDEPTLGIDIPTKNYIYSLVKSMADEGKGVIFVSSETDEVLKVSDRIAVFKEGNIIGVFRREDVDKNIILRFMIQGSKQLS